MNFHAVASLLISVASLLLGFFVYIKANRKQQNITYALVALSISLWSFGQFAGEISSNKAVALLWTRINLAGGILALVFFVHFVLAFTQKIESRKIILFFTYLLGIVYLILDATPLFVADVAPKLYFRFYPLPGPTYPLFTILFFFCTCYGSIELFLSYRKAKGTFKNQLLYILLSSSIGFSGASTLFLPVFGIEIFPLGYYLVPIYIFFGVYAIVKHRLLDLTIVIRKGLVYSILAALLSSVYVGSVFLFGEIFQSFSGGLPLFFSILLLFLFSIVFNPLRERLQNIIDRVFFKSRYDLSKTLNEISNAAMFILDLNELLEVVLHKIVFSIGAKSGAIYLKNKQNEYDLKKCTGSGIGDSSIAAVLNRTKKVFINGNISIPMFSKGKLVGFINLGEKLSDEEYSDEDIKLFETLANHLATAVENASLHNEIIQREKELFRAEKLSSLGTLSAGMAHEIKNPLAIIKSLAQSMPENMNDAGYLKKLEEVIPRQLDRINNLVEDLITFSKPKKSEKVPVNINNVLKEIIGLVDRECRKNNIEVTLKLDSNLHDISADKELMSQAFLNLILNAIQSMKNGGQLRIESACQNDVLEILISDTGKGILKSNIEKIFDPFFTTKSEGSGLGLAVAYRIIKEHGGEIAVQSEVGKGSKFSVSFL